MNHRIKLVGIVVLASIGLFAQDKAALSMNSAQKLKPGDKIALSVTLNEPLPEGAYFSVRLSPTALDQEVPLAAEATDQSRKSFIARGTIPQGATGGEWRVK